jgi:hypothetical protein
VQVTLDPAPIRIGSEGKPLPRRAQLRELATQSVECFGLRLGVPSLQSESTSCRCYRKLSVTAGGGVKEASTLRANGQLPTHSPAATVVA